MSSSTGRYDPIPEGTRESDGESQIADADLLNASSGEQLREASQPQVHLLRDGVICRTDPRARKRSRERIVVEATDGFIPLWEKGLLLRWEFNAASLVGFQNPAAIKTRIRGLLRSAIMAWGDALPVRFTENSDNSDFQIVVEQRDDCTPQGCVLAQAFFPDAGRHPLYVFPKMFAQSRKEQVETLAHEIGHVFGLRHFFAPEMEAAWPSEIFGEHKPFSIMNYGANSELTNQDRIDLKKLYEGAWNGQLQEINGTPIKLVRPFHYRNA